MKITFIGHACFMIEEGNFTLLIDPFISGNPHAKAKVDDLNPTHIFVSHNHGDHKGDALEIAKRSKATVFTTNELGPEFTEEEIETVAGHIGGRVKTEFGSVKYFQALHGSGISGGFACGFVIEIGEKRIYHAGDTGLTKDMELLKREKIDFALLPIGDFYTMGPDDALEAVKMIEPEFVIPMHYNTFPPITQNPEIFKKSVENEIKSKVIILNPGEFIEI